MRHLGFKILLLAAVITAFSSFRATAGEAEEEGEKLYKKYCRTCHKLSDQTLVGPGFYGVTGRRSEAWLDSWIRNPKGMIAAGDKDAVGLKEKFKTLMPTIKIMEDEGARKNIIAFLKENDGKTPQ